MKNKLLSIGSTLIFIGLLWNQGLAQRTTIQTSPVKLTIGKTTCGIEQTLLPHWSVLLEVQKWNIKQPEDFVQSNKAFKTKLRGYQIRLIQRAYLKKVQKGYFLESGLDYGRYLLSYTYTHVTTYSNPGSLFPLSDVTTSTMTLPESTVMHVRAGTGVKWTKKWMVLELSAGASYELGRRVNRFHLHERPLNWYSRLSLGVVIWK